MRFWRPKKISGPSAGQVLLAKKCTNFNQIFDMFMIYSHIPKKHGNTVQLCILTQLGCHGNMAVWLYGL